MGEIVLKSKLIRGCDYRGIDISGFAVKLEADPVRLERDLLNFRRRYAEQVEARQVERLDMVTVTCHCENPRFQKEHLTLRVGTGLFSRELEDQMIGIPVGDQRVLSVGGCPVTLRVEKCVREILPELSDELARRCGIPGIATKEDIITYVRGNQFEEELEGPADDVYVYLAGQVMENSEFELDEGEVMTARNMMLHQLETSPITGGRPLSQLSDEECMEKFGATRQQMEDGMLQSGDTSVKAAVLGQEICRKQGKLLRESDYEDYLARMSDGSRRPVEETRRKHPLTEYILDYYGGVYMDGLEEYSMRKLMDLA